MGKGSKSRVTNTEVFRDNHDLIFKKSQVLEKNNPKISEQKSDKKEN